MQARSPVAIPIPNACSYARYNSFLRFTSARSCGGPTKHCEPRIKTSNLELQGSPTVGKGECTRSREKLPMRLEGIIFNNPLLNRLKLY